MLFTSLAAGIPVEVVSERLGHASPTVTLTVYATSCPVTSGPPRTRSPP